MPFSHPKDAVIQHIIDRAFDLTGHTLIEFSEWILRPFPLELLKLINQQQLVFVIADDFTRFPALPNSVYVNPNACQRIDMFKVLELRITDKPEMDVRPDNHPMHGILSDVHYPHIQSHRRLMQRIARALEGLTQGILPSIEQDYDIRCHEQSAPVLFVASTPENEAQLKAMTGSSTRFKVENTLCNMQYLHGLSGHRELPNGAMMPFNFRINHLICPDTPAKPVNLVPIRAHDPHHTTKALGTYIRGCRPIPKDNADRPGAYQQFMPPPNTHNQQPNQSEDSPTPSGPSMTQRLRPFIMGFGFHFINTLLESLIKASGNSLLKRGKQACTWLIGATFFILSPAESTVVMLSHLAINQIFTLFEKSNRKQARHKKVKAQINKQHYQAISKLILFLTGKLIHACVSDESADELGVVIASALFDYAQLLLAENLAVYSARTAIAVSSRKSPPRYELPNEARLAATAARQSIGYAHDGLCRAKNKLGQLSRVQWRSHTPSPDKHDERPAENSNPPLQCRKRKAGSRRRPNPMVTRQADSAVKDHVPSSLQSRATDRDRTLNLDPVVKPQDDDAVERLAIVPYAPHPHIQELRDIMLEPGHPPTSPPLQAADQYRNLTLDPVVKPQDDDAVERLAIVPYAPHPHIQKLRAADQHRNPTPDSVIEPQDDDALPPRTPTPLPLQEATQCGTPSPNSEVLHTSVARQHTSAACGAPAEDTQRHIHVFGTPIDTTQYDTASDDTLVLETTFPAADLEGTHAVFTFLENIGIHGFLTGGAAMRLAENALGIKASFDIDHSDLDFCVSGIDFSNIQKTCREKAITCDLVPYTICHPTGERSIHQKLIITAPGFPPIDVVLMNGLVGYQHQLEFNKPEFSTQLKLSCAKANLANRHCGIKAISIEISQTLKIYFPKGSILTELTQQQICCHANNMSMQGDWPYLYATMHGYQLRDKERTFIREHMGGLICNVPPLRRFDHLLKLSREPNSYLGTLQEWTTMVNRGGIRIEHPLIHLLLNLNASFYTQDRIAHTQRLMIRLHDRLLADDVTPMHRLGLQLMVLWFDEFVDYIRSNIQLQIENPNARYTLMFNSLRDAAFKAATALIELHIGIQIEPLTQDANRKPVNNYLKNKLSQIQQLRLLLTELSVRLLLPHADELVDADYTQPLRRAISQLHVSQEIRATMLSWLEVSRTQARVREQRHANAALLRQHASTLRPMPIIPGFILQHDPQGRPYYVNMPPSSMPTATPRPGAHSRSSRKKKNKRTSAAPHMNASLFHSRHQPPPPGAAGAAAYGR